MGKGKKGKGGKGSKKDKKDKKKDKSGGQNNDYLADDKKRSKGRKGRKKGNNEAKGQWNDFARQLQGLGLTLRNISADGNCLFRSIADQLDGSQQNHKKYREQIVQFMEDNPDDFAPFVDGDFQQYCSEMRKESTWGGNLELAAAARAFRTNVIVHQHNAPRLEIKNYEYPKAGQIHLSYHNHEHYSSVRQNTSRHDHKPADVYLDTSKPATKATSAAAAASATEPTHKEEIVMQQTGCRDLKLVRETLKENWDDIDASVEYIYALSNAGYEFNSEEKKEEPPKSRKQLKKEKKREQQRLKQEQAAKKAAKRQQLPKGKGGKPKRIQNMSNRERKELARQQKEEQKRAKKSGGGGDSPSQGADDDVPVKDFGTLAI